MYKENIKRAANAIINALLCCDDAEFVDEVIARIATADHFEIETKDFLIASVSEETENDNALD